MRFLVALDLEDGALETLQQACKFATQLGADRTAVFDLVYVDPTRNAADFLAEPEVREQLMGGWDKCRVRFQNKLEMLLFRLPRPMRGKARVEVGDPANAILRVAGEYDAVVVGSKARSTLSRWLTTSVADRVLRGSPVPVWVMRPQPVAVAEVAAEPQQTAQVAVPDTGRDDENASPDNVLPFRFARSHS